MLVRKSTKILLIFFTFLLLCSCGNTRTLNTDQTSSIESEKVVSLSDDDFSMVKDDKEVSLDMPAEEFIKEFNFKSLYDGKSIRIHTGSNFNEERLALEFSIDGLKVIISNPNIDNDSKEGFDRVISMEANSNKWQTKKGVKLGDTIKKLVNLYGNGDKGNGLVTFTIIYKKGDKQMHCVADFEKNEKIKELYMKSYMY